MTRSYDSSILLLGSYTYTLSLKCPMCEALISQLAQINNVFLIVAITAIMAIVTAVLTFFVDMVTPSFTGNATQTAADAVAVVTRNTPGH